jgi:hypothetical protein
MENAEIVEVVEDPSVNKNAIIAVAVTAVVMGAAVIATKLWKRHQTAKFEEQLVIEAEEAAQN